MTEPLEILIQSTPNPNAAKFTLNRTVAAQGTTYRLPAPERVVSQSEAAGAPACPPPTSGAGRQAGDAASAPVEWARQILEIPGVTQAFAVNNFISVSKRPDADWGFIGPRVEQILRQAFA